MFKKIIFFFALVAVACSSFAQDYPEKSNTLVTDYTNTLSADDKQKLENKLVAFNDSSSTQIAVVLIKSVGDYDIGEYGTGLGRKWGIGQKGKNNGVLVLAAISDHKVTIQTGYGAEGPLPDALTSKIIEEDIKPHFRQNDYYGGLDVATDHIIQYTKGEYKADKKPQHKADNGGGGIGAGVIIFIVLIFILIFRNRGGGGGQIIGGRGSASPFWWLLAGSMLGGGGRGGSGGGWGGGSSGGGGGGGFGGFGGGSFGGGGSSGSW